MTSTATNSESGARLFPPDFVWGVATAAYQIEGAVAEDGRTPSIWDTFSHRPGAVRNDDNGDVADDHYHRMSTDVALMAELGLPSYRFSTSWSRILPHGGSKLNQVGLDFYSRLVDELLSAGITPLVTLYHWDLPQELEDLGGWTNRATAEAFAEFASVVGTALGDRIHTWITLNEPWCSAYLGYSVGVHAPGICDNASALSAVHHLNLAHGLATTALRAVLPASGQVSITLNLANVRAASDSTADRDAARLADGLANRVFLNPVLDGYYPEDVLADTADVTDWAFVRDGDLSSINQPIDLLGINYYQPTKVAAANAELHPAGRYANDPLRGTGPTAYPGTDKVLSVSQPGPYTGMGWRIEPDSLRELLVHVHETYPHLPLLITENGSAWTDVLESDGSVHDADRVAYLEAHIAAVHDAISQGVDIRGYYAWSLLDNFEWAYGYGERFGLVFVDYGTQMRTVKDSGRRYREIVEQNGVRVKS